MTLNGTLGHIEASNLALWEAIFSAPFDGSIATNKNLLIISYIDIALETNSAICLLIRHEHKGAAMALVRSVFEAMYKGVWVVAYASEADAERMRKDTFDWKGMGSIVADADKAYGVPFFEPTKKATWKSQNSFTHSGKLQIARRFTGNDLLANYPDDELKTAAMSTLFAAGLLAVPFLRSIGRDGPAADVDQVLQKTAIKVES